jgi:hypothetical protein
MESTLPGYPCPKDVRAASAVVFAIHNELFKHEVGSLASRMRTVNGAVETEAMMC